jgi:hypothetical protein
MTHRECKGGLIHEVDVLPIKRCMVLPVQTRQDKMREAIRDDSWSSGGPSVGIRGLGTTPEGACSSEQMRGLIVSLPTAFVAIRVASVWRPQAFHVSLFSPPQGVHQGRPRCSREGRPHGQESQLDLMPLAIPIIRIGWMSARSAASLDPVRAHDNNNNTFTWSGPRGLVGCTGQARVARLGQAPFEPTGPLCAIEPADESPWAWTTTPL